MCVNQEIWESFICECRRRDQYRSRYRTVVYSGAGCRHHPSASVSLSVSENLVGFGHSFRLRAKDDGAEWRGRGRPEILEKNRGMGRRNEAVAVPSRDASRTDLPRPFALQAAHICGTTVIV